MKVNRENFSMEKFSKELDKKDIAKFKEQGPPSSPQESLERVAGPGVLIMFYEQTSVLAGLPGGILLMALLFQRM